MSPTPGTLDAIPLTLGGTAHNAKTAHMTQAELILVDARTPARHPWAGPALVAVALASLLLWTTVFVVTPLAELPRYFAQRYLVLDATSMLFLLVNNSVFLGISVYMSSRVSTSTSLARDMLSRVSLTLAFMVAMNLGVMANNLLLLWAFIELTALCLAPLVAQGNASAPRRVAWHYLLYSSMSLALTFLGIMCLTRSAYLQGVKINFALGEMATAVSIVGDTWQHLGLSLMLFGLGSKLGLAPLYGWMPETYEAAPSSTSALLAAVQFNISVVAVFRILQVFRAQDTSFVAHQLLIMGCLSLVVAAIQVMAARSYKRLIAYACVSSSGVIAIGLSVGKAATYGVLLYVISNAFVKALLFLTAGRLRAVYGTNEVKSLSGVIRVLPFSGLLFAVGTFALLGFPPFGSFMAEMLILSGIVQSGNLIAFTMMCTMLTIIFVATGRSIFPMLWGPSDRQRPLINESWLTAVPKLGFVVVLVLLGVYTPAPISQLLLQVAQSIGGQ
ncbi:complex I subunit 5 family protein [Variovorax sp. PBL-E5]|uniref:complex I subunit 5 family protein n=1 Tax=Variovorax sp. PBL-E5 TaxID=434014 RepID=UPI0013190BA0|nr:proton-conducting transporter membrane subunit [Variovorax sp. PBL-E5]VTU46150.1 Multiple resistance and pH homeostasis protein D [Variovorax sp. PBL-E5]